jgi:hypothetical protein
MDISITILQHTPSTTSIFTSSDVKTDPFTFVISMDQQSIVTYLRLKGLNTVEIHDDRQATLKGEAKSYRTVTYHLRKPSFSSAKTHQPSESPAPILNESDEAILRTFLKSLSHRCRSLRAEPTDTLPRSTTTSRTSLGSSFDIFAESHIFCRKLTSTLGYNFHLNSSRCSSTRKDRAWHGIVILDESWFCFAIDNERIWLPEETEAPERTGSPFSREK